MKKYIKNSIVSALAVCFFSSCGGGNDSASNTNTNTNTNNDNQSSTEFSDIIGVWNASYDENVNGVTRTDEVYVVIRDSGETIRYDYFGDGFYDASVNCYYLRYFTISRGSAENVYVITPDDPFDDTQTVSITSVNDILTITDLVDGEVARSVRSVLNESDFSPECTLDQIESVIGIGDPGGGDGGDGGDDSFTRPAVEGYIWSDSNEDNIFSSDEEPLSNWTIDFISSDGFSVGRSVSNSDGYYFMIGLGEDSYTMQVLNPAGDIEAVVQTFIPSGVSEPTRVDIPID